MNIRYFRCRLLLGACSAALLCTATPAAGQRLLKDAASDVKHGVADVLHVWTSPAHMQTSDLEGIAVVAGVGGILLLSDEAIQEWVRDHPSSVFVESLEPFRLDEPLEEVGDIWYTFRYSAAAWAVGLVVDSETMRDAAMGCLASGVAQAIPRRLLYKAVARTRPGFTDDAFDFDVPGESEWSGRSFPGGHAANAFSCISYLGNRYSLGFLEPVLYAAAVGASLARVPDEAHWASDTWFGMALGYAVGRAVAQRALDRAATPATESPDEESPVGLDPADLRVDWTADGLQLGYRIRF